MKTLFSILLISIICVVNSFAQDNPFLKPYDTPFNVPPFDKIKVEHYLPAFKEGIKQQEQTVERIVSEKSIPGFSNTIEALENSDILLSEVGGVFYNMRSANTSPELQEVSKEVATMMSRHSDNILLNKRLFEKIKYVYENKEPLNVEQAKLLKDTYDKFVKGGAGLDGAKQARLREINEKLSLLGLKFGDNLLAETNGFKLVIESKDDLAGLPQSLIDAGAETAKKLGMGGKWVYTLSNPSVMPFLQYSAKRELREKIWRAYMSRGNSGNANDNNEVIKEIVSLRLERANLLGYKTHADFVLEDNMAKNAAGVYGLIDKLWKPSIETAKREAADIQAMIDKEGGSFKLQPWDWRYYTEKIRKEKYDLDEEMLKPYFELNNVRNGIFTLANKLFGITFTERTDVPKYHEEARTFEVKDEDGSYIGIFYLDMHPRASKRGGAWMNNYRDQYVLNGKNVNPIIGVVCNFTRPTGDTPALLTFDEAETFFHEFGHSLQGFLSKCSYKSTSGTNVSRDYVELPSQIMENWASEPAVMDFYAKHYKTGEMIPKVLLEKMDRSSKFNQGFATTEYLAASYLDMAFYTRTSALTEKPGDFEEKVLNDLGLIPEIISRYKSTYFNHIFNSGYSAGYYSYIWSQVLDADAFQAFVENGLFDKKTASLYRKNILEKGANGDPMENYIKFRGKEPSIDALMKRKGMK
ncbi:MAG: M3 family metallopeptidase [Ignavibacteriae bacterium]|nr:M3 family metallopeptidase [Ignavibacteriota bacterium]